MVMTIRTFSICLMAALCVTATASAAIKEDRASLTFGISDYHFDSKMQGSNRTLYTFGLGYDWTQQWGAELVIGRFKSRRTWNDDSLEGTEWSVTGVRHYCEKSNVVPFVLAGVGYQSVDQVASKNLGSRFAQAGVGIKYFFAPTWSFRVDARFIFSRFENQTTTTTIHQNHQNRSVMFGLSKRFDFIDSYPSRAS